MTVVLGAHNLKHKEKSQQSIQVAAFYAHPKYHGKFDNDIMLLKVLQDWVVEMFHFTLAPGVMFDFRSSTRRCEPCSFSHICTVNNFCHLPHSWKRKLDWTSLCRPSSYPWKTRPFELRSPVLSLAGAKKAEVNLPQMSWRRPQSGLSSRMNVYGFGISTSTAVTWSAPGLTKTKEASAR